MDDDLSAAFGHHDALPESAAPLSAEHDIVGLRQNGAQPILSRLPPIQGIILAVGLLWQCTDVADAFDGEFISRSKRPLRAKLNFRAGFLFGNLGDHGLGRDQQAGD
jgi:hypothetical protein